MKTLLSVLVLSWLCSCNTLYVSPTKTPSNTTSIGVEWNYGDVPNEDLQQKIDSALNVEIEKFNTQGHAFAVHHKNPRDKDKDYITVDFEKGKVIGTGGKIAGYAVTAIGLIAAPVALIAAESPVIIGFYFWPMHNLRSKVTLSPNLSGERKNNKSVWISTGALFASTDGQVKKLVQKYATAFQKTLLDVETQLVQH
jgi:hypothetical protein